MKNLLLLMLFCSMFSFTNISAFAEKTIGDGYVATCRGSDNCRACSSCSSCGHCNSGGSCGVCSPKSSSPNKLISKPNPKTNTSASSQCNGVTKKGAQCKRMVKGGGYCYQHK